MEVILLEKIGNLGGIGDKVRVKSGFGRNYLVPQGKAVFATKENIADFEARRAELEAAAADKLTQSKGRAAKLAEVGSVTIKAMAGDEGKLFGSVGPREIEEAANSAGADVQKSEIHLPEGPIRQIGELDIEIQFHADVIGTLKVIVEAE